MKVAQVVFSTNRLEYLYPALTSQAYLYWPEDTEVHRFLFDDFPYGRNDAMLSRIACSHKYSLILHEQNESLGATWAECWRRLQGENYDYIWNQEDDVTILEPINLQDLMAILKHKDVSQVRLARQGWYSGEPDPGPKPNDDLSFDWCRIEKNESCVYFSPMASLYRGEIAGIDFKQWYRIRYSNEPALAEANPNEGLVGKALLEGWGQTSRIVKNKNGGPLVHHMGNYTQGRILLPNEPTAERWLYRNPEKRYCSKTGKPYV